MRHDADRQAKIVHAVLLIQSGARRLLWRRKMVEHVKVTLWSS